MHCDCNINLKDNSNFAHDATKKDYVIYVIYIAEVKTLKKGITYANSCDGLNMKRR